MGRFNGLTLPGPQQPSQMVIASPLNDVQLVAFVASNLNIQDPKEAVERAVQIVVQSIKQAGGTKLMEATQAAALAGE